MAVKKTIGIIDGSKKIGTEMALQLANSDCRLLLISNHKERLKLLTKEMIWHKPMPEIDFVECAKDVCWEADVIILTMSEQEKRVIAEQIKAVAIQKIVLSISEERTTENNLQSLLPNSKVINIYWHYPFKELEIMGKDAETSAEISNIFREAGFSVKSDFGAVSTRNFQIEEQNRELKTFH